MINNRINATTMYIKINNMPIHVPDATVRQIIRCHKEGWQPVNIASICGTKPAIVHQVLKEKKLL